MGITAKTVGEAFGGGTRATDNQATNLLFPFFGWAVLPGVTTDTTSDKTPPTGGMHGLARHFGAHIKHGTTVCHPRPSQDHMSSCRGERMGLCQCQQTCGLASRSRFPGGKADLGSAMTACQAFSLCHTQSPLAGSGAGRYDAMMPTGAIGKRLTVTDREKVGGCQGGPRLRESNLSTLRSRSASRLHRDHGFYLIEASRRANFFHLIPSGGAGAANSSYTPRNTSSLTSWGTRRG